MKEKIIKKRYWAMMAYPESLPTDWKDILIQTGLPIAIGPLHDRDIDTTSSDLIKLKKPHYHLILCYSGPTTFATVKSLTDRLNQPIPIPIDSVRGAYDYFTHANNPEKAQYETKDIVHINGFSLKDYTEYSRTELLSLKQEVHKFIILNGITEYCDLLDSLLSAGELDLYDIAVSHTILFNTYISSRRHKISS